MLSIGSAAFVAVSKTQSIVPWTDSRDILLRLGRTRRDGDSGRAAIDERCRTSRAVG
jgi:hypothetical protein